MGRTGNRIALLEASIERLEGLIRELKVKLDYCYERILSQDDRIGHLEKLVRDENL